MRPRYRLIWLPAAALLLPCAFVGALGYRWLALEREAAERRSSDSARMAAAALTGALRDEVRNASLAAAQALEGATGGAPFRATPPFSAPLADAFLFDSAGQLRRPDYQQQAGRALSTRAFELLALARRAHAAGDTAAADRHAGAIQTCCADARDEYGASLPLYAAWLRVGWYASRGTARAPLADLARELRTLVEDGFIGREEDVTALSLLARRVPATASRDFADLVTLVSDVRARTARRVAVAGQAAVWLSKVTAPDLAGAPPVVGTHRAGGDSTLLAAARVGADRVAVVLIDGAALADRVAVWATEHPSFDITLSTDASPAAGAVLVAPLFQEAPDYNVVVRPRTGDPATDTRRDRLFGAAIVAALTLTLLLGYLAMRDVTREIGTASLRSAFVAGVTHELRTPVASIRLLAETLRQGRARPDAAAELLDTIVDESDRLTSLVDNVLTSSRIDGGAHVYRARPVSPPDVVRSAIRRFDSVLRRGGFVLTEQIEDASLHVVADPDALERSVLNLLGNAVKYSGTGRHIRVQVGRRDGHAEISVADDGIGVPASEQKRIFERFYRSPAAAADSAGTGLGLALARHFVEAHDGRISVRSEPGRGSVFVIALPLLEGSAAPHEHGEAAI